MILERPDEYFGPDVFVGIGHVVSRPLYLKCEGFNFAGSIKMRTATYLVDRAERAGLIGPDTTIVESSSGNLGVALAMIAASRSLSFVCVTDPNCTAHAIALMQTMGARVEVVELADGHGSYLKARKRRAQELCATRPGHVWLNQYDNPANVRAHYETTARSIEAAFPQLDVLFVGTSTGGTLMGCVDYLRERGRPVEIVAVDVVGSVNFGGHRAPRHIAGLGSSEPMHLIDEARLDAIEWVNEADAVRMCRRLAGAGLVLGGSSGAVTHGALSWLERNDPSASLCAVAIAPDLGNAYLETIYDDTWCAAQFGELATPSVGARPGGRDGDAR
jgi:2,3-diaminopropionate biosynthesis protein SbnA